MTNRVVETEYGREMSTDIWYDVPDYEDLYQVTRAGTARSKLRYVNSPICGGLRLIGNKVLKFGLVRGYLALQPVVNGVRHSVYLHRILAKLFIPNPDDKTEINHIDGDKTNNNIENLEWCTHLENMRHAFKTGLAKYPSSGPGEASPAAKLNNKKVRQIKQRLASGETQRSIAASFGVAPGTIAFIASGETWGHIGK